VEQEKENQENAKIAAVNKRLDKVAGRILDLMASEKVAIGEISVVLEMVNDKVKTASLSVRAHRGRRRAAGARGRRPRAAKTQA